MAPRQMYIAGRYISKCLQQDGCASVTHAKYMQKANGHQIYSEKTTASWTSASTAYKKTGDTRDQYT
eukprot:3758270-Karenia_brevis.AAC.1